MTDKKLKLSYSSIEKYRACSESYRLHYVEKIRQKVNHSALVFGSALDEALNVLLLKKKKVLSEEEQILVNKDPFEVFYEKMDVKNIEFSKSDTDEDLLIGEDIWSMSNDEKARLSLRRKGELIIKEYGRTIMPRIFQVISIQSNKELINEEGDVLVTKTDFIADWETEGNTVLFDNKTASRKYSENSVKDSNQLSIYSEAEEINKCGYIVCLKAMRKKKEKECKKCNSIYAPQSKNCRTKDCDGVLKMNVEVFADIQVVIDDIPESTKTAVFDDIQRHTQDIRDEKFEKNYDSCFMYGRKCAYYDYCRNGSMNGLVDMKEEWNKKEDK